MESYIELVDRVQNSREGERGALNHFFDALTILFHSLYSVQLVRQIQIVHCPELLISKY